MSMVCYFFVKTNTRQDRLSTNKLDTTNPRHNKHQSQYKTDITNVFIKQVYGLSCLVLICLLFVIRP